MSQGWNQNNQGWGNQGQQGNNSWGNQGTNATQNQGLGQQGNNGWGNSGQNQGNNGWGNQGNNGWGNQQPNQNWNNQSQNNNNSGWGAQFIQPNQPTQNNSSWNQHKGWGTASNNTSNIQQNWGQPPTNSNYPSNNSGWGDQAKNPSNINNSTIKSKSKFDNDSEYYLVTGLSNEMVLCLSLEEQTRNKGVLCKRTGAQNQKFKITQVPGGKYKLTCVQNGMILQIPNSSSANGVSVFGNYASNKDNQLWQFIETKDGDGGFFIKSFCGKCLDVCEQKTVHGTPIIQYNYNGGKNQVWYCKQA